MEVSQRLHSNYNQNFTALKIDPDMPRKTTSHLNG